MVAAMDEAGFGACTNHGECEAACPKGISSTIADEPRLPQASLMGTERRRAAAGGVPTRAGAVDLACHPRASGRVGAEGPPASRSVGSVPARPRGRPVISRYAPAARAPRTPAPRAAAASWGRRPG
jgi:hypothetical protein